MPKDEGLQGPSERVAGHLQGFHSCRKSSRGKWDTGRSNIDLNVHVAYNGMACQHVKRFLVVSSDLHVTNYQRFLLHKSRVPRVPFTALLTADNLQRLYIQ